jgi:hypothetical protein
MVSYISEIHFCLVTFSISVINIYFTNKIIIIYPSIMEDGNNMNNNCSHNIRTR